jgi:phosphatidylglycerophosphatase A
MIFLAFVIFRILDIWKPWPIGWLDRKVKGAFGVMIDDYVAGLIASVLLVIIKRIYDGNF